MVKTYKNIFWAVGMIFHVEQSDEYIFINFSSVTFS